MNAIHKAISAFDTDKTRPASKTVIEILSLSCFVILLVTTDSYHLKDDKLHKNWNGFMQGIFYEKVILFH